jgi:hypothetical protein
MKEIIKSSARVSKLRKDRLNKGLKRRELYATDNEYSQLKDLLVNLRKTINNV